MDFFRLSFAWIIWNKDILPLLTFHIVGIIKKMSKVLTKLSTPDISDDEDHEDEIVSKSK